MKQLKNQFFKKNNNIIDSIQSIKGKAMQNSQNNLPNKLKKHQ